VPDLAVRTQVVGPDDVARVDFLASYELVYLDRARGFQRDVLELLLGHLDVGVGVHLEGFHDVFGRHILAGLGVHARVLDAVTSIPIDLVEADLFGIGNGRVERDGTGDPTPPPGRAALCDPDRSRKTRRCVMCRTLAAFCLVICTTVASAQTQTEDRKPGGSPYGTGRVA
jgi:hypothetical protein